MKSKTKINKRKAVPQGDARMTKSSDSAKGTLTRKIKADRETESGELKELRRGRESWVVREELTANFGTFNIEDASNCPEKKSSNVS